MKKIIKPLLLYGCLLSCVIWALGFCVFVLYALSFHFTDTEKTDAIVVLTGGADRISTAVELLQQQQSEHLLISGMNKQVLPMEMFKHFPTSAVKKITLGYFATTTAENALESATWVKQKGATSILLVTSFYHMPRSILEMTHATPNLKIIPYPVFPKSFGNSVDWIKTRYAWLLFIEYHKFITVYLKYLFIERL